MRVLHGTINAVPHLLSSLASQISSDLAPSLLQWLDDILLHCPTIDALLNAIATLFVLCARLNLRLHPDKCLLYESTVRWCGRLINKGG